METKEVLLTRRSVHYFDTSKQITDEQIKELFDLVKLAPSGFNLQPWEFVLVRDPENKKRLRKCAMNQKHVEEASAMVIVCGNLDPSKYADKIFEDWVNQGYFDDKVKEKNLAHIRKLKEDKDYCKIWTVRSTVLSAMQLMIAAKDMGIATCPMEGFDPVATAKEFGIPKEVMPIMLIAMGYESKPPLPQVYRRPVEEIVHFEKF